MDYTPKQAIRGWNYVSFDPNARAHTLQFILMEVGWDNWFGFDDLRDKITPISVSAFYKRLGWLTMRKWLKTKRMSGKKKWILPSTLENGKLSKGMTYCRLYGSFVSESGYLMKNREKIIAS